MYRKGVPKLFDSVINAKLTQGLLGGGRMCYAISKIVVVYVVVSNLHHTVWPPFVFIFDNSPCLTLILCFYSQIEVKD